MKKRVVFGLAIFTSVFVLGGIYLVVTIEKTTSTLNNLIELHRVEILREQLLMNARKIQSGLALRYTRSTGHAGFIGGKYGPDWNIRRINVWNAITMRRLPGS